MQIVITDGFTLNPGEHSWQDFRKLGEVHYYDRTQPEEVLERCKDATVIITNKTTITADTIKAASGLQLIAVSATGYNNVDLEACKAAGVLVCNVPGYGTHSVAQHTFALLLELTNHVGSNAASVKAGEWYRSEDWCYTRQPLMELYGKTLGILGLGKIGTQVGLLAQAFGMKVIYHRGKKAIKGAKEVKLHELFMQADFVSLHCPLTATNEGFVNKEMLELMKPTAYLVNTSRGQLINEKDLAEALEQDTIAGAALDVLCVEPPLPNHPLIGLHNCIVTPHTAWISNEARSRVLATTLDNVVSFLNKKPQNLVNQ